MHTAVSAFHHILIGFSGIRLLNALLAAPRITFHNGEHDNTKYQQ
jgi:hypothetical protein